MNPTRTPKAATPQQRGTPQQSKVPLPRRDVTPNNPPRPLPHWTSRVAGRGAYDESTMTAARRLKANDENAASMSPDEDTSNVPTPYHTPLTEKPLPSRPIAQLASLESPSRDSRGLIDATEQPLQIASPTSGKKREYLSLTPMLASAMETTTPVRSEAPDYFTASPIERPPATPSSMIKAAREFTDLVTGKSPQPPSPAPRRSSVSSQSSYTSATETTIVDARAVAVGRPRNTPTDRKFSTPEGSTTSSLPIRSGAVRRTISPVSSLSKKCGSSPKLAGATKFTRKGSPSSSPADSRPHSPSPASFSRPRPASGTLNTPSGSLNNARRASRLPAPVSRKPVAEKPTLINVKRQSPQHSPKSDSPFPMFGTRRLDAKTADILDHGIRRRQLLRSRKDEDAQATELDTTTQLARDDTPYDSSARASGAYDPPMSDYSTAVKSDEEMTFAQSSEDESEVTTPTDQPAFMPYLTQDVKQATKEARGSFDAQSYDRSSLPALRRPISTTAYRALPPTSPYTINGPLQSIHSEATLPTRPLSNESNNEKINEALSHLEGRGSPALRNIDSKDIDQAFGHLKGVFDAKNTYTTSPGTAHNTQLMQEDFATAQRFLQLKDEVEDLLDATQTDKTPVDVQPARTAWQMSEFLEGRNLIAVEPEDIPKNLTVPESAVSKWSDSTASEVGEGGHVPSNTTHTQPAHSMPSEPVRELPPPPVPPKDDAQSRSQSQSRAPVTMGFPSSIPAAPETLTSPPQTAAEIPDIARRRSSPPLGPARRETRRALPGFARPTKAAEAKRAVPSPSSRAADKQRGRQPSAQQITPRARSKSRLVLDKMRGVFAGKRAKRSAVPGPRGALSAAQPEVGEDPPPPPPAASPPRHRDAAPSPAASPPPATRSPAPGAPAPASPCAADPVPSAFELAETLLARARAARSISRRERLLTLAYALHSGVLHAREAQLAAEEAARAAAGAAASRALAEKSLVLLERVVGREGRRG